MHGGLTIENRVTFFIAALSHTFGVGTKPEFIDLNFPINDPLYDELLSLFTGGPASSLID